MIILLFLYGVWACIYSFYKFMVFIMGCEVDRVGLLFFFIDEYIGLVRLFYNVVKFI